MPAPAINCFTIEQCKNNLTRPEITRAAPGNIFKRRYASELMKNIQTGNNGKYSGY